MRRALLVIDVQESFRQRPADWAAMADPRIVEQVARLVAAARAGGDLVVWVLHAEPGTGNVFDPVLGFVRPIEGLVPGDGEPVVVKTSANAFTTTSLQQTLTAAGIRDLVVCGIRTDQCCETTTRVASDLGYAVTFVVDATTTSPLPGVDLSAAEIVARTAAVLGGRAFATVLTTDEVVGGATLLV